MLITSEIVFCCVDCWLKLMFCSVQIECNEPIDALSQKLGIYKVGRGGKESRTVFERMSYNGKTSTVRCMLLLIFVIHRSQLGCIQTFFFLALMLACSQQSLYYWWLCVCLSVCLSVSSKFVQIATHTVFILFSWYLKALKTHLFSSVQRHWVVSRLCRCL